MSATGSVQTQLSFIFSTTTQALEIGNRCVIPLGVTIGELSMGDKLSEGAESVVYLGRWVLFDASLQCFTVWPPPGLLHSPQKPFKSTHETFQ